MTTGKWIIVWKIVFVANLMVVGISIVFPCVNQIVGGFTTEIIGTSLAFSLAITFAEIAKVKDQNNRCNRLRLNLLEEIRIIVGLLREKIIDPPIDEWEMARSTGEYRLLDKETKRKFWAFYNCVKILKTESAECLTMMRSGFTQEEIDTDHMEEMVSMIVKKGLGILRWNGCQDIEI